MQRDHYLECFKQLDSYIFERSISEAFAELGGIDRELPQLDNTLIKSCYISHYLSNDLEQKWIRFLQIECTSSLTAAAVHKRFRSMAKANKNLSITFAGDDDTILCTKFSREVLKVQAFDGSGSAQLFLSSQLSGFNANEAATFLANPLVKLAPQADLATRLVSAQSARTAADGQFTARRLEQRWTVADVKPAMER